MKKIILLFSLFVLSSFFILVFVQNRVSLSENGHYPNNNKTLKQFLFAQKQSAKKQAKYDRPGRAMQYLVELRSEVGKKFAYTGSWRFKAYEEALAKRSLQKNNKAYTWTERGPANVGGRTRSIVVHPDNENEWWVAAVGGGIWHTADAGESWTNQSDELPAISTTTLALCLSNPDIIYAGTGEGFYNGDAIIGDGVMKTTDGGINWAQIPSTAYHSGFRYVNRIIVDPDHPDTVLAATNSGIYRSTDGGGSWTMTFSSGRIQQIICNPQNFQTQYMTYNSVGVYKSVDGGINWTAASADFSPNGRIEIAIAPSDPNILYAALAGYNAADGVSNGLQGFYRSDDASGSWTLLGDSPNWLGRQGWYDNTLAVAPQNPNQVIVGGIDLYKVNVDEGSMTAFPISHWYGGNGLPYVHADQHFLVLLAGEGSSYKVITANDGGIHYSIDSGVNWTEKNNGYNVTQYYDGDRNSMAEQYLGGTQDNGTSLSPGQADQSSTWTEVLGGDGFDCVWDKYNPNTVYGTIYDTQIFKSNDGGQNFFRISNDIINSDIFHTPLAINPFDSENLISATDKGLVYVTNNGGESWQSRTVSLSGNVKLDFSKTNENFVWAGSYTSKLHVSTDKGVSFSPVPVNGVVPNSNFTGINTSSVDDSTVYLTFGASDSPKIYKVTGLGESWTDITGNLPNIPVNTILEMPYDTDELWIGTDIGLFITHDGGVTWNFADDNLPSVAIFRLKALGKEVLAVTHGRGMFTTINDLLPDFQIPSAPPQLQDLYYGEPQNREVLIDFYTRSNHDSIHLLINDSIFKTYAQTPGFSFFKESYLPAAEEQQVKSRIVGFTGGVEFASDEDSLSLLNVPESNFSVDFSDPSIIISDDFSIFQPGGFNSPALHSPHSYGEAYDYIAVLKTPVVVKATSGIYYKDVVIVEPGEPGTYYPEQEMWDYVTVEGSLDGKEWQILIDPYDSRSNSTWLATYNAGGSGSEAMMVEEKINLNDFFIENDVVTIRFRLLSDPAVVSWGWVVDDIIVTDEYTGIDDDPAELNSFQLIGNYPNPFNPGTTIQFITKPGQTTTLEIFNTLGQRVKTLFKDKRFSTGSRQTHYWDGKNELGKSVATGLYISRLKSAEHVDVKRMLLLK